MAIRFMWSDAYSVGDEKLDNQHRHLFELGNSIQIADKSEARKYIMELYKYIRVHFDREENHMKNLGYPWLDEHREKHENLITELNQLSEGFDRENFNTIATFLHEWLIRHVLVDDKKYFIFARTVSSSSR